MAVHRAQCVVCKWLVPEAEAVRLPNGLFRHHECTKSRDDADRWVGRSAPAVQPANMAWVNLHGHWHLMPAK